MLGKRLADPSKALSEFPNVENTKLLWLFGIYTAPEKDTLNRCHPCRGWVRGLKGLRPQCPGCYLISRGDIYYSQFIFHLTPINPGTL